MLNCKGFGGSWWGETVDTREVVSPVEGVPAVPAATWECFAYIYFKRVKIPCLLRHKVTPQKAVWTTVIALPADSGHVIAQCSLACYGPQHTAPAKP